MNIHLHHAFSDVVLVSMEHQRLLNNHALYTYSNDLTTKFQKQGKTKELKINILTVTEITCEPCLINCFVFCYHLVITVDLSRNRS